MSFSIEPAGPERLQASGQLDFATAAAALDAGLALIASGPRWTVDLSGVSAGDSAGVAVLVEWLSAASTRGAALRFESVPPQMLAIARISDLEDLLLAQDGPPAGGGSSGSGSSSAPGSWSGSSRISGGTSPS